MLIALLKFLHMLFTLGLSGAIIYCIILVSSRKFALNNPYHHHKIYFINRALMWLMTFTILTGTLLIYPKHFTFHTPWIQAAYTLVLVFSMIVGLLIVLAKKNSQQKRWLWLLAYMLLAVILIGIIRDAVTKTTLLQWFM
jgi:cell division protein FtsW (lipid II flippase)